jgi:hypothetical protein
MTMFLPALSLGFLPNLKGVYLFNNWCFLILFLLQLVTILLFRLLIYVTILTPTIPPSVANSTMPFRLNLSFNSFMGSIPNSLTQYPSLTILALQQKNISWGQLGHHLRVRGWIDKIYIYIYIYIYIIKGIFCYYGGH